MSQITTAAAEGIQNGWIMGLMTAVFLGFFMVWTYWAYRPSNRSNLDRAARLPFEDGEE